MGTKMAGAFANIFITKIEKKTLKQNISPILWKRFFSVHSSSGYLDIAEKYDPDADSWRKIPSTIWKRAGACGAIIQEKVFVFGGLSSTAPSVNFIKMYD